MPISIRSAIDFYARHPISAQGVLAKLRAARGNLDNVRPEELWAHDQKSARLQADVQNLNNRLNLIDFAGLFSGNSIAAPRGYSLRLQGTF